MCSTVEPQHMMADYFDFGLGPILSLFSIIGINLKKKQPGKRTYLRLLYDVGLLLGSISIIVMFFVVYFKNFFSDDNGLGVQLLLFFQTKPRWNDLWCSLQNLRRFASPKSETKCRKLIIIGLIYLITSAGCLVAITVFNVYNKGYSSCLLSYLDIWSTILFFYPLSGIVLFCALCRITSGHIDQIQMEVDELIAHKPIDIVDRVKRLAENYFYITELVHQINHCFGLILLFILSTHVVLIYTGIVFISSHYKNGNDWYDFVPIIYYSIVFSVNILAVSFASDAVSKKAAFLPEKFSKLSFHFSILKSEAKDFLGTINYSFPQISAAGFFTIQKSLVTAVISGVSTFSFLFFQFYIPETA